MAAPWESAPEATDGGAQQGLAPWATAEEINPEVAGPKPEFRNGSYMWNHLKNSLANLPNLPGNIRRQLGEFEDWAGDKLGIDHMPHHDMMPEDFPITPAVEKLGLVDPKGLDQQPENFWQRAGGTAADFVGQGGVFSLPAMARGAAVAGPGVLSKIAGAVGPLVGDAVSNAAGGVGAQAGAEYSGLPAPLGSLLGATGASSLARGTVNTAARQIPGISSPNETVKAMDRLGVPTKLVGDVSGSTPIQAIQNVNAELLGGGAVHRAVEESHDLFSTKANEIAGKYGTSTNLETGGRNVADLGQKWVNDFLGRTDSGLVLPQSSMWDRVWSLLPKSDPVETGDWESFLKSELPRNPLTASQPSRSEVMAERYLKDLKAATNQKTAEVLPPAGEPPLPTPPSGFARLGTRVGPEEGAGAYDPESGAAWTHPATQGPIPGAIAPGQTVPSQTYTYTSTPIRVDQLKDLHSRIGKELGDPGLPADYDKVFLKQAYGVLSGMLERKAAQVDAQRDISPAGTWAINPNGLPSPGTPPQPSALQAFNDARNYTTQGHKFIDEVLTPFVKQGGNPATAMQQLLSGMGKTGETVQALRDRLPQAADEVAATKLRMASHPNVSEPEEANPPAFTKSFAKITPEAHSALFGNDQDVADLNTWAKSTSPSLSASTWRKGAENLGMFYLGAEGARKGFELGAPHGPFGMALGAGLGAAAPFIGAGAVGQALTSTTLARRLGRTASTQIRPSPAVVPLSLSGLTMLPKEQN